MAGHQTPEATTAGGLRAPGVMTAGGHQTAGATTTAGGPQAPEVTTAAGPALVDGITREAADRQEKQGLGRQAPDAAALLPDTARALPLTLTRPATAIVEGFGKLGLGPARAGTSPLTYRLCVESADTAVACSAPRPLATPAATDLTGDGLPDLAATLLPTAGTTPGANVKSGAGGATVGLTFAVRRLTRASVKAQVWAEYDGKVSVGFDGLRRGTSLSALDRGTFTVDLAGRRVKAEIERREPGASAAVVAGLTGRTLVSLRQTPATARLTVDAGLDPPSLDVSGSAPATLDALVVTENRFTQAVLDRLPAGRAHVELGRGTIRFTAPAPMRRAELHHHVYRDGRLSRLAGVTLRGVPPSFTAAYATAHRKQTLTIDSRHRGDTDAEIRYFDRDAAKTVLRAQLSGLPRAVRLVNDLAGHRVTHTTSSPIGRFAVVMQRNEGAIATPRGGHVTMIKNGAAVGVSGLLSGLSGFDVTYGRTPHVHLEAGSRSRPSTGSSAGPLAGPSTGSSEGSPMGSPTGSSVGSSAGPSTASSLGPSMGPFVGAAVIDGRHLARLEISNTPATVDVTLDPAARKAVYRADGAIDRLRAAYANLDTGPTVDGTVLGVRGEVRTSWEMGERSRVEIGTSSTLRRLHLHATTSPPTATSRTTEASTTATPPRAVTPLEAATPPEAATPKVVASGAAARETVARAVAAAGGTASRTV
ncbi:hypothetical protein HII36_53030, partial [Nonomuraea sp. NN258]|nr:hypothetical protein [Nonomuraea antri]